MSLSLVLCIQVDVKNFFLKGILALPWVLSTHLHGGSKMASTQGCSAFISLSSMDGS